MIQATPPKTSPLRPSSRRGLEYPAEQVAAARHDRPVVIVHGTLVDKESITAYRDYALKTGHPVDLRTYKSVQDGGRIEDSARQVAGHVNQARQELAQTHLDELKGASPLELQGFFQVDSSPRGQIVTAELPWLLEQVSAAVASTDNLSYQLQQVEQRLAQRLGGQEWADKAAAQMVDCLAPKATLVGHSAGGFVAYAVAVNPRSPGSSPDLSYDGGLGVGQVVVLSSPIGKGMSFPAPPGLAEMPFYNLDSKVLRPLESTPPMQLASLNPFFAFNYALSKSATKMAYTVGTQLATAMAVPLIYAMKPGYEEVSGFSNFFKECIQGKPVPEGVTVVAVTSPDDKMALTDRSQVDDSQPNAHNFEADLQLSAAELKRERPTWGHVQMSTKPVQFLQQFDQKLLDDPRQAQRFLDPANDDGSRYHVLQVIERRCQADEDFLTSQPLLQQSLQQVADEGQPFLDSPSALAQRILDSTAKN
ncbi:hypothetical protein IV102_38455 [bacterium]|nr:hypothetical protein [bacterium]